MGKALSLLSCLVGLGVTLLITLLAGSPASASSPLLGSVAGGNQAIVAEARLLQAHLSGYRANEYDPDDPVMAPAYRYWLDTCGFTDPTSGARVLCPQARSGNLQCVMFVLAVFALAHQPLPIWGNGNQFWELYQHEPGWRTIPATIAPPAERGLPEPGDIMAWTGGLYGHVAIVLDVVPPTDGYPGSVEVAEANAPGNTYPGSSRPGNTYTMPIEPDLRVETWPGYAVQGYLRSARAASPETATRRLVRISQLDPAQYASQQEYITWAYSACSAAAMTEVVNAYTGKDYRITDLLRVEARLGEITPELGLVRPAGIAITLAHFGFKTTWNTGGVSLDALLAVAHQGTPVIVSFPPERYPGGHLLVLLGGTSTTVTVADSSAHHYQVLSRTTFLAWWGGFYAIPAPE